MARVFIIGSRDTTLRLARTILIGVFSNSVLSASRLAIPLVALGLGASEFTVGALAALVMVVPVLTTAPFGRWMDRVGTLTPMRAAVALSILSGIVAAIAPSVATLCATAVMVGAGAMFSHVVTTKAVGSVGDADIRVRTLGLLAVAYSSMQFAAPLLVGFAFDHGGARAAFAATSVLPLLAHALLLTGGHLYAPAPSSPPTAAVVSQDRANLLADARLRTWGTIYAVFQAALTLFPVVVTLHGARLGMNAAAISGLLAAQAIGAIASRVGVSLFSIRSERAALVGFALLVSAFAYGVVPFLSSWIMLAIVGTCLGAATGLGQPVSMSMVYGTAPPQRLSEAISLASTAANVLQLVTPFISGALAELYGVATMTTIVAVSLTAAAVLGATRARG
jgi:MFS family permease